MKWYVIFSMSNIGDKMYYKQNIGSSKENIVRLIGISKKNKNDVILQNIFDGLVFALEKKNFEKFYEKYELTEAVPYEPDMSALDEILDASGIEKVKEEMGL